MSDTANYLRAALGQGLGMGWGDEAEAWVRSKLGEGSEEDIYKDINKNYAEFSKRNPILAPVAEFAGGVLPLVASYVATPFSGGAAAPAAALTTARSAGALAKLGSLVSSAASNPYIRGAVVGGTTGAVSGAGSAEPDRRGEGAAYGATIGAPLGVAIPAVLRGGSGVLTAIRDRVPMMQGEKYLENRAAAKISDAMRKGDTDLESVVERLQKDKDMGVPSILANADRSLEDLAERVVGKGGKGARIIEKALDEQGGGARDRVLGQVKKTYGTQGDFYGDEEKIIESLRTKAKPHYDLAESHGEVKDPKVLEFMELPQFKKALDLYEESLAARGKKLPTVPVFDASGKEIGTRVAPTVKILNEVKKNLDDLIEKQTDNVTRKRTTLGDAYKEEKNLFLTELDRAVPDYGVARAIYKGDAEVRDALRSGMNDFNKLDHEQITKLMKSMGASEREAFTTGSVRNIQSTIMNSSGNINAAEKLVNSPETRAMLLALAEGNQSKFDLLRTALERESQLFQETSRMLSSSTAAGRNAAERGLEGRNAATDFGANLATGSLTGSLFRTAAQAIRRGGISDAVAERIAEKLASKTPNNVAAGVQSLENLAAKASNDVRAEVKFLEDFSAKSPQNANNVGAGVKFLKDFADKSAQNAKNFNKIEASNIFATTSAAQSAPRYLADPTDTDTYLQNLRDERRGATKTESNKDVDVFLERLRQKRKEDAARAEAARKKADQLTGAVKK